MKEYEYKFVEIPRNVRKNGKVGDAFEECKRVILAESENGWQLKQVVTPFNEKTGVFVAHCYQIILERKLKTNENSENPANGAAL